MGPQPSISVALSSVWVALPQNSRGATQKLLGGEKSYAAAQMDGDGLEFLMDPVDRFPLPEVTADVEMPDLLVLTTVLHTVVDGDGEGSSCAVLQGQSAASSEGCDPGGKRRSSPARSVESTGKVNPEAPGWTKRLGVGCAPPDRAPCADRVTAVEITSGIMRSSRKKMLSSRNLH